MSNSHIRHIAKKRTFIRAVNSSGDVPVLGPLGATAPLCNPGKAKAVPYARILKRSRDSKRAELKDVPAIPYTPQSFPYRVHQSMIT